MMGVPTNMFTPLFVIATRDRLGCACDGAAHRRQDHPPSANYTGPENLAWIPIEKR